MQNDPLNKILREWSNDRLPDETKQNEILQNVFGGTRFVAEQRPRIFSYRRRVLAAVLVGFNAVAAIVLFVLVMQSVRTPEPVNGPVIITQAKSLDGSPDVQLPIRVSILVLRRIPGSESAVEFLEDCVLIAEEQKLHEVVIDGHRMFLWIYPLEKSLYSLDIAIDKAAETGVVAVPDRTQSLQLKSNGDHFDVFVSVLPNS